MQRDQFSLQVGDSFTFEDSIGNHLHVIVAEYSPDDSGFIMLVYLSTSKKYRDPTTIINSGEHSFITRTSWVRYQNIKICQRSTISGKIIQHFGKVDDELLSRIQDGILKSQFTSRGNKNEFSEWRNNQLFNAIKTD